MSAWASFLAGLQSTVTASGITSLVLVSVAAVVVPLRMERRTSTAFLFGLLSYVVVAGAEYGTVWPALDRPSTALSTPLAWIVAVGMLVATLPALGPWRVTVLLGCAAALRPASYGPQWLLSHAHGSSPALLLYHLGGVVALAVCWVLLRGLFSRLGDRTVSKLAPVAFGVVVIVTLSGAYGVLLRELLARWPLGRWG